MFLKQKRRHENNANEKSTRPVWKMNLQCVCQEGWAPGARLTKETVCSAKGFTFSKKNCLSFAKDKSKIVAVLQKKVKEKSKSIAVLFSIADTDVLL